eukprot:ANDGO_03533.mRNA.1 hypothetical protein (macronuclear)
MIKPCLVVVVVVLLLLGCSCCRVLGMMEGLFASGRFAGQSSGLPTLYELSTRPWLYELSSKYGRTLTKITDIPMSEFQSLKNAGVDIVWLMGVWSLGAYGMCRSTDISLRQGYGSVLPDYSMNDIIGSPYAVTDYTVNPELGTDNDVRSLRKQLNSMGLKLMLDFVPNHFAVDTPHAVSNPEYFTHVQRNAPQPYDPTLYMPNGIGYGKDPYSGAWPDTIQINYWNSAARDFMTTNLIKVASMADAIRTDMTMLLLNDVIQQTWGPQLSSWGYARPASEFWSDAIAKMRSSYPNTILLAECYWNTEATLESLGFDFTYDKTPYDKLVASDTSGLQQWIRSQSAGYLMKGAHFVENHDEQTAIKAFGSPQRAVGAVLVLHTLPGMRFNFHGQWNGFANKLEVHLRRSYAEPVNTYVASFYQKFLPILADPVFKLGTWTLLAAQGDQASVLFAWSWAYGSTKRLCVINYSSSSAGGTVVVPDATAASGDTITITDLLSGQSFQRSASQMRTTGLVVVVNSYFAQIFSY